MHKGGSYYKSEFLITGGGGRGDADVRVWSLNDKLHPHCLKRERMSMLWSMEEEKNGAEGKNK